MQVNDTVKFKFGKKQVEMEGQVIKVFDKTVYLKVDFPGHKGKILKRRKHTLT